MASLDMPTGADARAIFIARQPIFDRDGGVWGYELLFRDGRVDTAEVSDPASATAQVIIDGLALVQDEVGEDTRLLINFPARLLFEDGLHILPSERCIPEILETVEPTPEVIENIARIREAGFQVALDDYVGQPGYEELLQHVDLIKVDVLGQDTPAIVALTQRLKDTGCRLLAEKIEDRRFCDFCRALGYDLFQGFHFGRPQLLEGRTLHPSRMARLRLLAQVADPDYEVRDVGRLIASDISLSFRLMRFVNSAAFGWSKKVESLEHAVTLLGRQGIRQWLTVALLTDMEDTPRARELSFTCVKRGRFLQLLARGHPEAVERPGDVMFMLGLFSRLDAFLDQPMEEIAELLPMSEEMRRALCGEQVGPRRWLDLCECIEQGRFDESAELARDGGIESEAVALAHGEAGRWTGRLLEMNRQTAGETEETA